MLKKIRFYVIILLFMCLKALPRHKLSAADEKPIPVTHWALSLEAGSGNILGIGFARKNLLGPLDIGIGAGVNYEKPAIGDNNYNLWYFNGNTFSTYCFFDNKSFTFSARLQIGYDILSAGTGLNTQSWDLTPGILIGFKNLYAALSGVCLLTKEFAFIPQIGLGYGFHF